jgi:predicted transposase YdaD
MNKNDNTNKVGVEKVIIYKFPNKSRQELEQMFDLTSWKQTQFYQDVKLEGKLEGKLETIPLLKKLGLTIEQIAQELKIDVNLVRQNYSNDVN